MFYALSTNYDQWKQKINLFVALAPVVYMSNTDDQLLKLVAKLDNSFGWFMRRIGKHEVLRLNTFKKYQDNFLCRLVPGCRLWQ